MSEQVGRKVQDFEEKMMLQALKDTLAGLVKSDIDHVCCLCHQPQRTGDPSGSPLPFRPRKTIDISVSPTPNKQETHGLTGGQGDGTDLMGEGRRTWKKKKSRKQVAGKKNSTNHFLAAGGEGGAGCSR